MICKVCLLCFRVPLVTKSLHFIVARDLPVASCGARYSVQCHCLLKAKHLPDCCCPLARFITSNNQNHNEHKYPSIWDFHVRRHESIHCIMISFFRCNKPRLSCIYSHLVSHTTLLIKNVIRVLPLSCILSVHFTWYPIATRCYLVSHCY